MRPLNLALVKLVVLFAAGGCSYQSMETSYQRAQDPVRKEDTIVIVRVITEYSNKNGSLPLEDLAISEGTPFMVLIGRSYEEEEYFSKVPALDKSARIYDSRDFEALLSEGLGTKIVLPRDPQKVATFAPNVYLYYVDKGHFCVVAHLYEPSEISCRYEWEQGVFFSHANCFDTSRSSET